MTILHLRICPERHPNLQSNPGKVNLDNYDFADEDPEMWQTFLLNVATQVGGSHLGDPTIHEPGQCGDSPVTRSAIHQLKSEYAGADDSEDYFLVHFEQAPPAGAADDALTEADVAIDRKVEEQRRSESDGEDIILPKAKKVASKSRKAKRAPRSRARDKHQEQGNADDVVDEMSGTGKKANEADQNDEDERIDETPENVDKAFGADEDVEEEAPNDASQPDLTRSNDDHLLIRIGIYDKQEDAEETEDAEVTENADGTENDDIDMDIVIVAEIISKDEIHYHKVPSWFMNGISIGHFERGTIVKMIDIPTTAWTYTPDRAFTRLRTVKEIEERLLELSNNTDTKEVALDEYNHMEDEEVDDDMLIQPPITPELMDGPFPAASTAKGKAKATTKGKAKKNDENVDVVVYFVNNIPEEDLPLDLNRQLYLKPEETFANFDKWLLDGQGKYKGIRKGLYNEVDKGGWNLWIEYEVFVLPQRPKKEGRMWNWKKQSNRTVASFLNASMEEEYGRKLYIEVHLNVHPDVDNMDAERVKKFENDPKFRKRVEKARDRNEQSGGSSEAKGVAIKTSSSKLKTKKSQEDLPARKGVARKAATKKPNPAAGPSRGTKAKATGKKAHIDGDEDESEHSDEL